MNPFNKKIYTPKMTLDLLYKPKKKKKKGNCKLIYGEHQQQLNYISIKVNEVRSFLVCTSSFIAN